MKIYFLTHINMNLISENISLSPFQQKKLVAAADKGKAIRIRLTNKQVQDGEHNVFLDEQQAKRLKKARLLNKGLFINFGEPLLDSNKQEGGIIPLLIPIVTAILSTAAAFATDKALKAIDKGISKKGKGLAPLGTSVGGHVNFCHTCGHSL